MKTRIAVVLPYFGNGGAENMVSRLVGNLDLDCFDVQVFCIYGQPLENVLEKNVTDRGIEIVFIGKKKGFSLRAVMKLWKKLSAFKPSVIHTHLSACVYCAPWVLVHRVKMLQTIHNMPKFELIRPKRIIMSIMYRLNKAVPVAISSEIRTMMVNEYKLGNQPELVYNPVDVDRFSIPAKPHEGVNLITAGRLSQQKNQKLLVEVMKDVSNKHSNVSLTILGDGPLRTELTNQIKNDSLDTIVHMPGNVNNVEQYFSESDIFILSSNYEGLPLVVLEAMAAGLPVVSTNVGGIKDIVTNNGILVEKENKHALCEAINALIDDPDKRRTLGKNSYRNVQRFDSSIIASEYENLYRKYAIG